MVLIRRSFIGGFVVVVVGFVGCLMMSSFEGDVDVMGFGGGDVEMYEVGYWDFQMNIEVIVFFDMLYFYCVQFGWMNWLLLMQLFEDFYGVVVYDDDCLLGEVFQYMCLYLNNVIYLGYNGGYIYGIVVWNEGFMQVYKLQGWDKVFDLFKIDDGYVMVIC